MRNNLYYSIAKCCIEKLCPKCQCISDAIVVDKGPHQTLYCAKCGAYIKHASVDDKKHMYVTKVHIKDETPIKVCEHYIESQKTMTRKLK